MQTVILSVGGMSCQHCVNAVKGAAEGLAGVSGAEVNLVEKTARVSFDESKVSLEQIKEAIEEQGFDVG